MIEAPEYVPLGSVVSLKGNEKKLMVIGRALMVGDGDGREYYDYAFCLYPEGMLGDVIIYSNHENIEAVHSKGFQDEEDAQVLKRIREALIQADIPKAQLQPVSLW